MNEKTKLTLWMLLVAGLIGMGTWWWLNTFEKKWEVVPYTSDAAGQNPMLAATRWMESHRYSLTSQVTLTETLSRPIPAGTLFLLDNHGVLTEEQMNTLLTWVQAGNTLITLPKEQQEKSDEAQKSEKSEDDDEEEDSSSDANMDRIGNYYGVERILGKRDAFKAVAEMMEKQAGVEKKPAKPPEIFALDWPELAYPLRVYPDTVRLHSLDEPAEPLWADKDQVAIRVFDEGKGHVVLLADNYFTNQNLGLYDHAELLLALSQLNPKVQHISLVHGLSMPTWYDAIWARFPSGVIGTVCVLLLLFWMSMRRFGPILPEPEYERRALLEHIDASGRWLWKLPAGRTLLLAAVRQSLLNVLQRRAPQLQRLGALERLQKISELTQIPLELVQEALKNPPANQSRDFTRQIQTLQQLRKFYER